MTIFTHPKTKILILLLILIGFYPSLALAENTLHTSSENSVSLERHLAIRNITHAGPPVFLERTLPDRYNTPTTILFTYTNDNQANGQSFTNNTRKTSSIPLSHTSHVAVVFAHEGWRKLHTMQKIETVKNKEKTVFFLYWDLDRETQNQLITENKSLEYRFIVDGVWMADPLNPVSVRKINGALVSMLDCRSAPAMPIISPEIVPTKMPSTSHLVNSNPDRATLTALAGVRQARTVYLRYSGKPGLEVFVAGSFNQFDPYILSMTNVGPDPRHPEKSVYQAELRLLTGQYYYHFVINGETVLDGLNVKQAYGTEGTTYSLLQVP